MKHFYNLLVFILLFINTFETTLPFRKNYQNTDKPRKSSDTEGDVEVFLYPNQSVYAAQLCLNFITIHKKETTKETSEIYNCSEDCDCMTCNYTLPAPKKIINPYKQELSNIVPQKPFGNFCVKCVACLAIAHEIENVIKSSSQECETDPEKKKMLLQNILKHAEELCLTGFKNFNLRAFGNHSIITNKYKCTRHIITSMDGNWTKKLRELCTLYTSKMNLEDISINVLDSIGTLADTMCRGTGIFRDCSNIKSHENITLPVCQDCNT